MQVEQKNKIKCKVCGCEVDSFKYHKHVMDTHCEWLRKQIKFNSCDNNLFTESCFTCHHKKENHMPDLNDGSSKCDFPDCDCKDFKVNKNK